MGERVSVVCARPLPPAVVVAVGLVLMMVMDVVAPLFPSLVLVMPMSLPEPEPEPEPAVTGMIVNTVTAPLFESAVFILMIIVLAISVVLGISAVVIWVVGRRIDSWVVVSLMEDVAVDILVVLEDDSLVLLDNVTVVTRISAVLAGCVVGSSGKIVVCGSEDEENEETSVVLMVIAAEESEDVEDSSFVVSTCVDEVEVLDKKEEDGITPRVEDGTTVVTYTNVVCKESIDVA